MIRINEVRWKMSVLAIFIGLLICSSTALAIPSLQLDILSGLYENKTTYSQGSSFTLYALLIQKTGGVNRIGHKYTISASIVPKQDSTVDPDDFGSFTFGSETIKWGTPPSKDPGALPSHGIFPTFYWEHTFMFDKDDYARAYNVSKVIGTHTGPQTWEGDTRKMYYMAFDIDTSGLNAGYEVHFDLYHVSDNVFIDKAPFSHDAESRSVPEPGSLVLFGVGLMGVAMFGRRKK